MIEIPGMLAAAGFVWAGMGMSVLIGVVGALYVRTGLRNVRERVAEERGKARLTNAVLGVSNTYEGRKAVALGWVRIIGGAVAVVFAIVMLFVWMSLADR